MLKAIVNLLSYGQKRFLILITLSHIRKTISLEIYIFLSIATRHFLIHFRGRRRLLLFNGVLFLQEISNYIWIMTQLVGYKIFKGRSVRQYQCKTSRVLLFSQKLFKKSRKNSSIFVWLPRTIIIGIHSFSSQLYEIITNYQFKEA